MVFGFGRIEFDGNFINLNRPWSGFQPHRFTKKSELDMDSGLVETHKFFSKWFINARLNLLDPQEKAQLQRLFEYAEDGSSFTLIRDRNLGTYIPFEGGINPTAAPRGLKTIDDTNGAFTRTTVADADWYLDEGTGLLTERNVTNQPRFPAGKYGAGIQIDGAAVNLITAPSGPFDSGNWVASGGTPSTDTPETLDPAGTSIADKILTTGANQTIHYNSGTAVGNNAAAGIWLKTSSGSHAAVLTIEGTGGGVSSDTNIVVIPEWKRFPITADSSGFTTNLRFRVEFTEDATVFYIYGASLFDSAQFDKGTIGPTQTSSSITRNAEKLTYLSANIINRDKGTVLMWVKPNFDPTSHSSNMMFFESGDSGGAEADAHVRFFFNGVTGNRFLLQVKQNNAVTNGISYTPATDTGLTQGNLHQIACTWDSTISDGGRIYVDGANLGVSSTNSAFNISEPGDTLGIGVRINNTNHSFSTIDEVLVLKNVLTSSEIKGLFDLGIGLGVSRNRWTVQLNDQVWNPRWLGSDVYDIPLLLKEVLT